MVMSDWEKQREGSTIKTWTNQKAGKRSELVEIYKDDNKWIMVKMIGQEVTIKKSFSTKPKALAYAKSYMRSH